MYKYINECVSYCLKGNIKKCTLNLIGLRLLRLTEIIYFISVLYLFVYDTSFVTTISQNTNEYITKLVCVFAVIVGFVFHFFTMNADYSHKKNILSQFQSCEDKVTKLKFLIKLSILRFIIFTSRIMLILLLMLPSTVFLCVFLKFVQIGINVYIFIVCIIGCLITFVVGCLTSLQLCQQYNLAEYYAITSYNSSIFECIK